MIEIPSSAVLERHLLDHLIRELVCGPPAGLQVVLLYLYNVVIDQLLLLNLLLAPMHEPHPELRKLEVVILIDHLVRIQSLGDLCLFEIKEVLQQVVMD